MKIFEVTENISHTSKNLRDTERERDVKIGSDEWFKLWFSLPYLKEAKITELFDDIYPYQIGMQTRWFTVYEFGDDISVTIEKLEDGDDYYVLSFDKDGEEGATGEGDQFKVFGTVMAIAKDFIKQQAPKTFKFSAEKVDRNTDATGRPRLYSRLSKTLARQSGYDVVEKSNGRYIDYILTRNQDVTESNPFTDARMNAIKAGKTEFTVGGKTYKVTGDTSDERAAVANEKLDEETGKEMLKIFRGMHHEAGMNKDMDRYIRSHDWKLGDFTPDMFPSEEEFFDYDDPFDRVIDIDYSHRVNLSLPIIVGPQYSDGKYSVVDGNHRAAAAQKMGKTIQAYFPVAKTTEARTFASNVSRKVTKESSSSLSRWKNKEPAGYVKHLQTFFGPPEELTNQRAIWYNKDGFKRIEVLDEFILHASPLPHYDYAYSYVDMKVPHNLSDELAASSESILIDHLKGEVGARCASLSANAVTLQYVMDVVEGNIEPSKGEYETRIKSMKKMFANGQRYELDWWPDVTGDTDPNNPYYKDDVDENFADGKNPGRKGLAKRSGVNTKASVSDLRKTAKNSSGEKQRMAHWLANMKAGRKKNSESILEDEDEIYYSKKFASVAKKIFKSMYPDAKVTAREDGDGYLSIETTDGVFGFSMGVTHQYGDNVITVANAYAGQYKGVVGPLVKSAAEFLKQKHPDAETTLVAQHDVSDNYWPRLANKLGINYENNEW